VQAQAAVKIKYRFEYPILPGIGLFAGLELDETFLKLVDYLAELIIIGILKGQFFEIKRKTLR